MSATTVGPNNRAVVYRNKPQREKGRASAIMPVVSKDQNAAMHSAAEGNSTLGIPQSVGREFIADQKPGSVKQLPQRVGAKKKHVDRLKKRGSISDRAAGKHLSKYGGQDQQGIDAASR